ncbi:hypothetical protein CDN99_06220 [Roseateles aquatilis]|uniref:TonB C-terminal domain-containing protein n=1 Tax=Roseateles aquatilis TaxID=431061 RepID=A0A246JH25_9BURK|nr:hypothetical protein CDN99_06220 [Roseateles aquatilis]
MVLAGCGSPTPRAPSAPAPEPARSVPVAPVATPAAAGPQRGLPLAAPHAVSSHEDLRRQAAERMVAANPDGTYMGEVPAVLLAIPVLEVELNRDGSVKAIRVLRRPSQAEDTIELAIAAVRKAAPYGDVSRLPHPWKFNEVFLFDDDRRFKPRTLDD